MPERELPKPDGWWDELPIQCVSPDDCSTTVISGADGSVMVGPRSADGAPALRGAPALPPGAGAVLRPRRVEEMVPALLRRLNASEVAVFAQLFAAALVNARERAEADPPR